MQGEVKEGTSESDELEFLSILVKEYELANYPIPLPNPLDAIKYGSDEFI